MHVLIPPPIHLCNIIGILSLELTFRRFNIKIFFYRCSLTINLSQQERMSFTKYDETLKWIESRKTIVTTSIVCFELQSVPSGWTFRSQKREKTFFKKNVGATFVTASSPSMHQYHQKCVRYSIRSRYPVNSLHLCAFGVSSKWLTLWQRSENIAGDFRLV